MRVSRWMSSPAITVPADAPASYALQKMMENEIRRLPVVGDDDRLEGWVTDRDLRAALDPRDVPHPNETPNIRAEGPAVRELMNRDVTSVRPDDHIGLAVARMHEHKYTGLPVCTDGRCVGVITVHDMLEVLAVTLPADAQPDQPLAAHPLGSEGGH